MFKTFTLIIVGAAAALVLAAAAATGGESPPAATDAGAGLDGAALFKTKVCFTCHGADAQTPILPVYPKLAGQSAEYALAQMKDIKSGARSNGQSAAMKGIMHLINEDEMAAIAEWLSTLER